MSRNKQTVQKYMNGFNRSDHAQILSCLTDDIEWLMPGAFHLSGKDAFVGSPTIKITRTTEESDVVSDEGRVRCARKDGGFLSAAFCDLFVMQDAKIRQLTTYQAECKDQAADGVDRTRADR